MLSTYVIFAYFRLSIKYDYTDNLKWRNKLHHENSYVTWRSALLIKGISKTIKNEEKEQKGGFLRMLLGTVGANLLGNLLTGKGLMKAGEGTCRAGQNV